MADATIQIGGLATRAVPLSYQVPAAQTFTLLGVRAVFDGAAAAGAFLPCVQIFSASGNLMAQTVGSSVAAGAAADVTFAPFLESATTSVGGGIDFDTFPQAGDWLYVETDNEAGSPNGYGVEITDQSAGGMQLEAASASLALGQESGLGVAALLLAQGGIQLDNRGTGEVNVLTTSEDGIRIEDRYLVAGGQGIHIRSDVNDVAITAQGSIVLSPTGDLVVLIPNADPGVPGALWNNAGVVNVSP